VRVPEPALVLGLWWLQMPLGRMQRTRVEAVLVLALPLVLRHLGSLVSSSSNTGTGTLSSETGTGTLSTGTGTLSSVTGTGTLNSGTGTGGGCENRRCRW